MTKTTYIKQANTETILCFSCLVLPNYQQINKLYRTSNLFTLNPTEDHPMEKQEYWPFELPTRPRGAPGHGKAGDVERNFPPGYCRHYVSLPVTNLPRSTWENVYI